MRKAVIFAVLTSFLSGCATFEPLERGLGYLMGEKEQVAFDVLGYPNGQQQFGEKNVYFWSINSSGTLIIPQVSTIYGRVGNSSFYGTTTLNTYVPVNYYCQIQLVVDSEGTLINWEYNGDINGCDNYMERVDKYYQSHQVKDT